MTILAACKNSGTDDRPEGCLDPGNGHGFGDDELAKVVPYGVDAITAKAGGGSGGIRVV